MRNQWGQSLLTSADPPPVCIFNRGASAPFLLVGDHAGKAVPARLKGLGISEQELSRHIGRDLGIAELGPMLAEELGASFVSQFYSRLVIDCNRDPAAADSIPEISDGTHVPGNDGLHHRDRSARIQEIHEPYHLAIEAELRRLDSCGQQGALVSLHSFTPSMGGIDRPWEIGVLYDRGDTALAKTVLQKLVARGDLNVGDNEPYAMNEIDYTVPRHAYATHRPYVELEIRQDLLSQPSQRRRWSTILLEILS